MSRASPGRDLAPPPRLPMLAVFRRLLGLMQEHRPALAGSVAAAAAAALLSLSPHLAVAFALTELLTPAPRPGVVLACAVLGAVGVLVRHSAWGLAMLISHRVAYSVQYDLRRALAEKLARVPLGFFDRYSKGGLRTTLLDDVNLVEDGMAHLVPEALAALLTPLLAFAGMALLDWRLALLALLPTAAGLHLLGVTMRRGAEVTRRYHAISGRMGHAATEFAEGLATVRAFNQQGQAVARVRAILSEYRTLTIDWLRRSVAPGSISQLFLTANLLLVAPVGVWLHHAGSVATAPLVFFLVLTLGMGDLFAGISGLAYRLTRQVAVLQRIDAILDAPEQPPVTHPAKPRDASVVFDAVSFAYGQREALSGVSFRAEPGQCVALVGESGAGKSTVTRLISRFYDAREGRVLVGGVDVRDLAPDDLHAAVAVVFQDVFLFQGTIAENIRLGCPGASDAAVREAARQAGAEAFVEGLPMGFDTALGGGGRGLSGGERQRISIARAILKDAPILLLDEATAFADPENEALIQAAIARLAAGRTVITIAHRLHTIQHADQILVFEGGRIVERGRHEPLLRMQGRYAALWAAQQATRDFRHGGEAVA